MPVVVIVPLTLVCLTVPAAMVWFVTRRIDSQ